MNVLDQADFLRKKYKEEGIMQDQKFTNMPRPENREQEIVSAIDSARESLKRVPKTSPKSKREKVIEENEGKLATLLECIRVADEREIDIAFSILRDWQKKTAMKLRCLAYLFLMPEEKAFEEAPWEAGQINDYALRHIVCSALEKSAAVLRAERNARIQSKE